MYENAEGRASKANCKIINFVEAVDHESVLLQNFQWVTSQVSNRTVNSFAAHHISETTMHVTAKGARYVLSVLPSIKSESAHTCQNVGST